MISEFLMNQQLKGVFEETRTKSRKACLQTSLSLLLCWGHLATEKDQVQQKFLL